MYDYTQYYTPFLHLQGLTIKRQTMSDLVRHSKKVLDTQKHRKRAPGGPVVKLGHFLTDTVNVLLDFSQYLLPSAIFFFKFLEWWYNEPRFQQSVEEAPTPPTAPSIAPDGLRIPENKLHCPICDKPRTNPAIAASGFAFCYPCIFRYVQDHKRCPITFIATDVDQIRKIYDSQI